MVTKYLDDVNLGLNFPAKLKKRKSDCHHGNLRAALIHRGRELIDEGEIPALILREIGKQLGGSRPAGYAHFADKGALPAAIKEAGFTEAERRRKGPKLRLPVSRGKIVCNGHCLFPVR